MKEKVINLYENLKRLLNSENFGEDLRSELHKLQPNYLEVLDKRMRDMEKVDHGIVIAGKAFAIVIGKKQCLISSANVHVYYVVIRPSFNRT